MNTAEKHARETLEAQGFRVEAVPRGPTRTADFLVHDDRSTCLVEVTGKEEGGFLTALMAEARRHGGADRTRGLTPSDTLDGIIRKKAAQLAQTPVAADFRVLWIAALHRDSEHLSRLLLRTLYGVAKVAAFRSTRDGPTIHECLYYHRFSFFRDRCLDAVIFSTEAHGMLCVNALSPRADRFRETKLYAFFGSPVDPALAPESTLVVAPEVDRTRHNAPWQYLKDRYGLMTSVMVEVEWRGLVSLLGDSGATSVDPGD